MKVAYVDSSFVLALAFGEQNAQTLSRQLARCERVLSAPLLEAEVRSAIRRENHSLDERLLRAIDQVIVPRGLGPEIARVLDVGYLRGADCLHVATALYVAQDPRELYFLTLDAQQLKVVRSLGFKTSIA